MRDAGHFRTQAAAASLFAMGDHGKRIMLILGACLLSACVPASSMKQTSVLPALDLADIQSIEGVSTAPKQRSEALPSPSIPAEAEVAAEAKTKAAPSVLLAGLPAEDIARIQAEAKALFARHWPVVAERSRYVRARIRESFEELAVPAALEVLPVVESGYNPYALSPAGAMGLWQLMPGTARGLGIRKPRHLDGRRHVTTSTRAALEYLLGLQQRFGNWPLALAAYHLGPAAVARRLEKQPWQPQDGLDALPLPGVTRAYVRHVLGLAALYHMGVFTLPEPVPTRILKVKGPIDLKRLASSAGMSKQDLFHLNPGLQYSQYLHESIELHVPETHYERFREMLAEAAPELIRITVRSGDSLWTLARAYGTSIDHLRRINPNVHSHLRAGQTLMVPASKLVHARPSPNPLLSQGRRILYKVRTGDNLWTIAKKFGTTPRSIVRANRLNDPSLLRPGDTLWILARIRPS